MKKTIQKLEIYLFFEGPQQVCPLKLRVYSQDVINSSKNKPKE